VQALTFTVSDVPIGVDIVDVVEAVRAVAISPLPGAPKVIEGLIDFRGTIVPVFDLRLRLLGAHADIVPEHHLIVASAAGRTVALHVDTVTGLVDLDAAAIAPAASQTQHIAGVASLPDGLVLIHDLTTFLSAAEQDSLDTALADIAIAS